MMIVKITFNELLLFPESPKCTKIYFTGYGDPQFFEEVALM